MKHDVAVKALKATIADLRKELSTKDKSCLDHIQLVTSEHAITVKCRGELATMRADLERVKNKVKVSSVDTITWSNTNHSRTRTSPPN